MKTNQLLPISIFLSALLVAGSIIYGTEKLTGGASNLLGSKTTNTPSNNDNNNAGDTNTPPPSDPQQPTNGKASLDGDPVLGDANAPVTMIEFSDYECPFCKRHFQDTFPQIKSEYIDTGKVKLVFRDLPLSFHDPLATKEAMAANCSREQGGDSTYFKFHDAIFKTTSSNGNGMTEDQLFGLADEVGINRGQLETCVNAEKYKDEIQTDLADAQAAGASATPTFLIGKTPAEGELLDGDLVIGAQPFTSFKAAIDKYLE